MDLIENSSQHSAADFTGSKKKSKTHLKLEPIRMVDPPPTAALPSFAREPSSNQELLTNSNINLIKKDSSSSLNEGASPSRFTRKNKKIKPGY
jgi:hypothetical protein